MSRARAEVKSIEDESGGTQLLQPQRSAHRLNECVIARIHTQLRRQLAASPQPRHAEVNTVVTANGMQEEPNRGASLPLAAAAAVSVQQRLHSLACIAHCHGILCEWQVRSPK
jgi:hypothetical protein